VVTKLSYYIRTEQGEKGPYTRRQIKEAIANRAISRDAECRRSDQTEWMPFERVAAQIADAQAAKREELLEKAPEIEAPKGSRGAWYAPLVGVAFVLMFLGATLGRRAMNRADVGKPCVVPNDCGGETTCFHEVDQDRKIKMEGYCTTQCSDASDCKNRASGAAMTCQKAIATNPQGATWDGTTASTPSVCMKY
jgi:hypothetical protein